MECMAQTWLACNCQLERPCILVQRGWGVGSARLLCCIINLLNKERKKTKNLSGTGLTYTRCSLTQRVIQLIRLGFLLCMSCHTKSDLFKNKQLVYTTNLQKAFLRKRTVFFCACACLSGCTSRTCTLVCSWRTSCQWAQIMHIHMLVPELWFMKGVHI